jgi:integrase
MMPVFKYAKSQSYISEIPEMDAPVSTNVRRPTFSLDEWRRITRSMREWIREGQKKATYRQRLYATQYFLILANSGLRVGEARTLKWRDLRSVDTESGPRIIAEVRGKTGVREVVFQKGTDEYLKRIWSHRCTELTKQAEDKNTQQKEPPLDEVIFCNRDGKSIHTFKRAFKALVEFSNVPIEKLGDARTIYSLRHFYATQRLQDNTNPFLLAKQMGTSIEMLENFYGQTIGSEVAEQLTKTSSRKKNSALQLPFL